MTELETIPLPDLLKKVFSDGLTKGSISAIKPIQTIPAVTVAPRTRVCITGLTCNAEDLEEACQPLEEDR